MNKRLPGLKSAYDKEDDGDVVLTNQPSPRPKDAATLILVRQDGPVPRVLLGKRSGGHSFMPEKYSSPSAPAAPPTPSP